MKDEFKDQGYIIIARYRREDGSGELENRIAYGPYSTREEAEKANDTMGFPAPELNEIIRLWREK